MREREREREREKRDRGRKTTIMQPLKSEIN